MSNKVIALFLYFFLFFLLLPVSDISAEQLENSLYANDLYEQQEYEVKLYNEDIYDDGIYTKDIYSEENSIYDESINDLILIGSYAVSRENSLKSSAVSSFDSSIVDSYISSIENSYVGEGQNFILQEKQAAFIKDFTKWQNEYVDPDFWHYVEEQEEYISLLYKSAVAKYGIGAAIIAVPYIVSIVAPDGGTIAVAATVIYKTALKASVLAMSEEIVRQTVVGIMENKETDVLIAESVNSGADGFLVGAVTGTLKGLHNVKGLEKIGNYYVSKSNKVMDETGKLLGKCFRSKTGKPLYYLASNGKKYYTLFDEQIDLIVKSADTEDAVYYVANELLKSLEDGKTVGYIVEKNGIKFVLSDLSSSKLRPFAAINQAGQLVTNNSLKKAGIKHASLATLFSDSTDKNISSYYRALYSLAHPNVTLKTGDVIHHSIERQVLKLFPDAFNESEILSDGLALRGIPKALNSDIHLSQIRKIWDETYDAINDTLYDNATEWGVSQQKNYIRKTIFSTKSLIDKNYGEYFIENKL